MNQPTSMTIATMTAISGWTSSGDDDRREPRHVRPIDRDGHDQTGQEGGRRSERKPEDETHEECPDAVQRAEDELAADEPGGGRPDAAPEEHRVLALVGRREVETEPQDRVPVDGHEDREADHDDRVDEGADRRQRATEQGDGEVDEAAEQAGHDANGRSR